MTRNQVKANAEFRKDHPEVFRSTPRRRQTSFENRAICETDLATGPNLFDLGYVPGGGGWTSPSPVPRALDVDAEDFSSFVERIADDASEDG